MNSFSCQKPGLAVAPEGPRPWLAGRPGVRPRQLNQASRQATYRQGRSLSLGVVRSAEEPAAAAAATTPEAAAEPAKTEPEEVVYYEGSGADGELVFSILLGFTLLYLPLTLSSVGRRLWVKYKFTNKRVIVTTSSPVFQREVQVSFDQIKEVRAVQRAFGLWGDMVIFLKDGSRLEMLGLDRALELRDYILGFL